MAAAGDQPPWSSALVARPVLRGRTRDDWLVALGFGVTLGVMNWAIYQSFARIPLGIAVTIEFIGPLTLAVVGSRRPRDLLWVAAGRGRRAPARASSRATSTLAGVLFALLAGAAWAAYILLSAQTGRRWPGLDGLAVASVVATVLLTPARDRGLGAALCSTRGCWRSARPSACSARSSPTAARWSRCARIRAGVFSILMSLEPAAAALAGDRWSSRSSSRPQWLAWSASGGRVWAPPAPAA